MYHTFDFNSLLKGALILGIICLGFSIEAQKEVRKQVPFYDNIYRIDASNASLFSYFDKRYPGVLEATLFQMTDSTYILFCAKEKGQEREMITKELTQKEYENLQERLRRIAQANAITEQERDKQESQLGSKYLKIQSLTQQSLYGGIFLSAASSSPDDRFSSAIIPLSIGGGVIGSIFATRRKEVPLAESMAYASGTFTGWYKGVLLSSAIINPFANEVNETPFLGGFTYSIGESVILRHLAKKKQWSASRASAIRVGNFSGFISGLGLSLLTIGNNTDEPSLLIPASFSIAGSIGGMALYDAYFKSKSIPAGNMQAIRIMNPIFTASATAAIGGEAAASPQVIGALLTAFSTGGIFLGEALFSKGQIDYSESLFYGLAAYGGGLIGIGIGIIAVPSISLAGGAAIFGLTSIGSMVAVHHLLANSTTYNRSMGFLGKKVNIDYAINPLAPMINKRVRNQPQVMQQPILSCTIRF